MGLIVIESHIGANTEVSVRVEYTVNIDIEKVADVEGSVESSLGEVELVKLSRTVEAVLGTLGLPTHDVTAETEDRAELITKSKVGSRADEVLELGLTDGLGSTATELKVPVRIELLGGDTDTHHQCGGKNKYSFLHKYKF
jgi:hypothetical protein